MDAKISTLLTEIIVIPVIAELAQRRGVHGATRENLDILTKNPQRIIDALQKSPGLRYKVIIDFADAIDNIAGDAVDALTSIFAATTPGGNEVTGDDT